MAFPVILIDGAVGSDSGASGAGPTTALTGSSASTSGDGLTVTLDGSPDLTNVATDGSHAIYLADSTAGARNFGRITAKDDGAKTVTVGTAFRVSASGLSWAIGGKRDSLFADGNSYKLVENNSGNGDILPGWVAEFQSAHAETRTSRINFRRAGDTTDGPIIIRGASGAATKPVITMSGASADLVPRNKYWVFRDFTLTGSSAVNCFDDVAFSNRYEGLTISGFSGDLIDASTPSGLGHVIGCHFTGGDTAIRLHQGARCLFNRIINPTSHGIEGVSDYQSGLSIIQNYISGAGGDGIKVTQTRTDQFAGVLIAQNRIYDSTGDAIEYVGDGDGLSNLSILLNILSVYGGYGINFSAGTLNSILARQPYLFANAFWANGGGSGEINPSGLGQSHITLSADPFVDAANGDLNINDTAGGGATLRGTTRTILA